MPTWEREKWDTIKSKLEKLRDEVDEINVKLRDEVEGIKVKLQDVLEHVEYNEAIGSDDDVDC